jgi:hypothetical protein
MNVTYKVHLNNEDVEDQERLQMILHLGLSTPKIRDQEEDQKKQSKLQKSLVKKIFKVFNQTKPKKDEDYIILLF